MILLESSQGVQGFGFLTVELHYQGLVRFEPEINDFLSERSVGKVGAKLFHSLP